ncbi:probable cytochrome P450 6d4 [Photinus pyralis]|uniref:probable cytochrome P450 6d4 n=1 Tax=Photinus pyralis TaxID=7054 RepID=UPI0012678308|nr:probable cytochrome P450 6d4 [Photinus pyralis]
MTYLDMVIKEALRKYPTLPFLDRECTKAYTIPNTNVVIQKGVAVYISLTALQHDGNYFPDPMVFNPERFSTENKSTIVPCTYMPFGEGYRNCLATKFGYLSVSIGVIKILSHFEIVPSKYAPKELTYENGGFLLIPTNDQVLMPNSTEEWNEIAEEFYNRWQIPNTILEYYDVSMGSPMGGESPPQLLHKGGRAPSNNE